jgi:hypothetical protein
MPVPVFCPAEFFPDRQIRHIARMGLLKWRQPLVDINFAGNKQHGAA